jgi:cell wall-associated NlpC family hydrolase
MPVGRLRQLVRLSTALPLSVVGGLAVSGLAIADPAPTLADVQKQVAQLQEQAEQAAERYNSANEDRTVMQRRLTAAQADVERQQARVRELTSEIGGFAAASYRTGGTDPSLHVLLADDPGDFLARASVVDAYATRQVGALRTVAVARQRLAEDRVTAAEVLERLKVVEAALDRHRSVAEAKLAKAQHLLNNLKAEERAALERARAAREEASRKAAAEAQARLKDQQAKAQAEAQARTQAIATAQAEAQARTQATAQAASTAPAPPRPTASPPTTTRAAVGTPPSSTTQRATQRPTQPATQSPAPALSVPASGKGAAALQFALAQVGEPYMYGGAGPDSWDCSGLTMMAWKAAGVSLPHGAKAQYASTAHISRSELQPGDLVFFYNPIHHVGIYAGNDKVVHAPKPGDVVSVDPLSYMPFAGASRPG